MRPNVREFLRLITCHVDLPEPIIEIGSFQVDGQEELANLRPLFPGKQYIGCDMRPGKGVDSIENVENLSYQNESIGTIICLDTLEHVKNIIMAKNEMHRVLNPNGFIIISSVMNFPIHDYPYDYWRFTPEAFDFLLDMFISKIILYQGFHDFPHTIFGIGAKSKQNLEDIPIAKLNNENIYIHGNNCNNAGENNRIIAFLLKILRKCMRKQLSLSLKLQQIQEKNLVE
jgi:SAM-dependent methyltransferase